MGLEEWQDVPNFREVLFRLEQSLKFVKFPRKGGVIESNRLENAGHHLTVLFESRWATPTLPATEIPPEAKIVGVLAISKTVIVSRRSGKNPNVGGGPEDKDALVARQRY